MSEEKNILFVGNNIVSPGGGERSLLQISEYADKELDYETQNLFIDSEDVESENFEVLPIIPSISKRGSYEIRMLSRFISPLIYKSKIEEVIERENPDLIVAQTQSAFAFAYIGLKKDIPVKVLIRADELLYEDFFHGKNFFTKILNFFPSLINSKLSKYIFGNATEIVANSEYTVSKYSKQYPELEDKCSVMYPMAEKSEYEVSETGDKILHVNPIKPKGIDITLDVAEQTPSEEFLIVGSSGEREIMERVESLENVEFRGFIEDMKQAYRESKIALFPSRREAFGRISVEAGYSGIPVIVSGIGGLSESMKVEDLRVSENEARDYVSKIKEVEKDYERYSELARKNADEILKESKESLEEILKI